MQPKEVTLLLLCHITFDVGSILLLHSSYLLELVCVTYLVAEDEDNVIFFAKTLYDILNSLIVFTVCYI